MILNVEFKGSDTAIINVALTFTNRRVPLEEARVYHTTDILKEFNRLHPKKVVKGITGPHKVSNCGSREEASGEWVITLEAVKTPTTTATAPTKSKKRVVKKTSKKGD